MSLVDIVIVNWNGGRRLRECLAAIMRAERRHELIGRVVIVDNASTDDSLRGIDESGLPVTVVVNDRNRGFAVACNQGARGSTATYLLFLNPDCHLSPNSLDAAVAFMEHPANAAIGITGIQLTDQKGKIGRTCARFPTPARLVAHSLGLDLLLPQVSPGFLITDWDYTSSRSVDQVMGAFSLVRRQVFESLQGFDERFFVYYEDLDFALRAARAGWLSYYLATARATHEGGGSSKTAGAQTLFYFLQSRLLYAFKHFRPLPASVVTLTSLTIEPLLRIGYALARLHPKQVPRVIAAYGLMYRHLGGVLRDARRRGPA